MCIIQGVTNLLNENHLAGHVISTLKEWKEQKAQIHFKIRSMLAHLHRIDLLDCWKLMTRQFVRELLLLLLKLISLKEK